MLIPTTFGENNAFIKIFEPYNYADYIAAVKDEFQIIDAADNIQLTLHGINIKEAQLNDIILQYWKEPSFKIDIILKGFSFPSALSSPTSLLNSSEFEDPLSYLEEKPDVEILSGTILNESAVRRIPTVQKFFEEIERGNLLDNKDRVQIAKAIIAECLKDHPGKRLTREHFLELAKTITIIFPSETTGTYFIPSSKGIPARGKLYNAYNNKRAELSEKEIITRRPLKRKITSPSIITGNSSECYSEVLDDIEYLKLNCDDWPTIILKWKNTFHFRKEELSSKISTDLYISNYPALQCTKGIELVTIDAKERYPSIGTIKNWNAIFQKIVDRCEKLKDTAVQQILNQIKNSTNNHYNAQLALNLIPYILPHGGKRSETTFKIATKREIHERFMQQFSSLNELNAAEKKDVHIKFVNDGSCISYAEFNMAGIVFKCNDLMEAVNIAFTYITALDVAYPQLCLHVWQFVQLAIFKVELSIGKVPFIETFVSDLRI